MLRRARNSLLLASAAVGAALAMTATSAQAATPAPHRYVALGDSYAAGAGVPNQSAGLCLRSDRNYGHLVAAALNAAAYRDVTCAAAKVKSITEAQYDAFIRVNDPQIDAVTADTDLITLGIGGNDLGDSDLGIADVIATCIAGAVVNPLGTPCTDVYHHGYWDWSSWSWQYGNDDLADRIDRTGPRLTDTVKRLRAKAPNARILLVGYPSVLPADGASCVLRQPIAPRDIPYLHDVLGRLNTMLQSTARATGATYVDTATPTRGHDVCSADRWVEGALPGSPAVPFHPNATGERVMADAVLKALG
ncbi:SGNH/GDSL hydrolase family protein [Kitasatospora purpeofusca]|uniref:SGNH/GDSL hydrolase family protein n=1 Tax=Kitasatospora purpeofusca TaxID=67352 RepID=UPI00224D5A89|nr:SGNH/GDSL hydrolase family protein [Kitasatospora purpeofusca]MCX4752036.1 SGNH/GDSL hydrolase family protein [Kitasatospora purpeofusca]MCX4757873.1 SGNH/GDSL hydrolase family protein [Kitasatospora purpeofusca]WSR31640.1 SGNH/GDSL hydrolase family protein [Kitasatospora purpeofusca]WSR39665.1 SGNH/GDSL hydrolase family protein [Kitasatospora purpeofusca]